MATVEEVAKALEELGLSVVVHQADPSRVPMPFINVHGEDNSRTRPIDTIWSPNPAVAGDGWAWGPSFQYGAYPDDDAVTVAHKISKSLAQRGL